MKVHWQENGIVLTGIAVAVLAALVAAEELVTRRTQDPILVTLDTPADADDEGPEGAGGVAVPLYGSQDELTARARELLAQPQPGPDLLYELARQARSFRAFALADELLTRCLELAPGRTESLFLRARTQSDLGNREQAVAMYEAVLKQSPNHQKATYNLGVLLRRSGDYAQAGRYLARAASISSGRIKAKALHQLGLVHAADGRWDSAVQYLRESVGLRPGAERVWLDLGEAEWKRGRLDAAHAAFDKALALNRRFADAHLAMGRLEEARGNGVAAGSHLARAVKLDGDSTPYRMALARHLLAEGDKVKARGALEWLVRNAEQESDRAYAQAMLALLDHDTGRMLREVRRAEKLQPGGYDDAIEQAAVALHGQKRYADARALLDTLLGRPSPSPEVLLVAARTASRLGDTREAESLLRRSLQARPESSEAWFQLGRLLSDRGDIPGAIHAYRASLERNPGARNTQLNLAVVYGRGGNEREALALYGRILKSHPRYTPALLNRARLHERAGRDADAIADLEAALRMAPTDDGIRERLARVLLRTGETGRARELLADAVAERPGDADTRLLLAETDLRAGRRGDALRELNRAASLAGDDAKLWARLSQVYRDAGDAEAAARADARARPQSAPAGAPARKP
jgi:tetratricopeptide (TPR) repeat protein